MKNYIHYCFLYIIIFSLLSCSDNPFQANPNEVTGRLFVTSQPPGARIFIDGIYTGKITPANFNSLSEGNYSLVLKLDGYYNSAETNVSVKNNLTYVQNVNLTWAANFYGPIKIYESLGTSVNQPNEIDISDGKTYSIQSINKDKIDIYYSSNGYLIKSANQASGLTRITLFKVGSGTNLTDGADSPIADNSWLSQITDRETNYVFLYDNDSHYTKLKITNWGGGTPGDPAWVEIQLIFNKQVSFRFF